MIIYQKRAKRAFGIGLKGGGKSSCLLLFSSQVAGPKWVKLSGIILGIRENVLAKEFFEKVEKEKKLKVLEGPVGFV